MGRLEDIVNADSLEALMALRAESGIDEVLNETKATPIQRAVADARAREAEGSSSSSGGKERDYVRDPIGRFDQTGKRDSQGGKGKSKGKQEHVVKAGDTLYAIAEKMLGDGNRWKEIRDASGLGKDFDPHKLQIGTKLTIPGDDDPDEHGGAGDGDGKDSGGPGKRRTADGGIDRDGDGDSDPATGKAGFARAGTLADVQRQITGWEDNVPAAKRREQRFRLLARAAELDASDEVLQKIRALPAPDEKKDDDVSTMETKTPAAAPVGLEHKAAPTSAGVQVLETDDETGIVTALVSVTGVVDNVKDQIEPGAYTKTMAKREPIGVWSHDDKTWVARTEDAVELAPGDPFLRELKTMDGQPWDPRAGAVKVTARFNLDTPHGAAAYSDVKFFKGKTGWSIGYRATKAHRNPATGVRHIKELDWYEYSPVMVGAASQPMTLSVKSASALHAVDPDDDTGLVDEEYLETLTLDELDRLDSLKSSLGLEVKARVRTAEGAKRYGQPIGSVIIPDLPIPASEIVEGMEVDFATGVGGKRVSGVVTKVDRNEITVDGTPYNLPPNQGVNVTSGRNDDAPISNGELQKLFGEAEDADEKQLLRAASALPPEKRRAFLTSGGKPDSAAAGAGGKHHDEPAGGGWDKYSLADVPEGDSVTVAGQKYTKEGEGWSGGKSTSDLLAAANDAAGTSGAPKSRRGEPDPNERNRPNAGGTHGGMTPSKPAEQPRGLQAPDKAPDKTRSGSLRSRMQAHEDASDKEQADARTASKAELQKLSDDELFDELTKVGRIDSSKATTDDRVRLAELSNERHRRAETGQGRFGKLKGKTRETTVPLRGPAAAEKPAAKDSAPDGFVRQNDGSVNPSEGRATRDGMKGAGTGLNEHSDPMAMQGNTQLEGFIQMSERMNEARREAGDEPFGDDHEVTKMLHAAQDELAARKKAGVYDGNLGSAGGATTTPRKRTEPGKGEAGDLTPSQLQQARTGGPKAGDAPAAPAGAPKSKDGQPANDKGENVSDFVNAVLSDVRDEEYRQMESELQSLLDDYEKDPTNSARRSALVSRLKTINEDGIDGENVDDALTLLEMAAYGGDGKPKPGQKAGPVVLEHKGSRASLDRSPKKNWVENAGELPGYIREVARAVEREQSVDLSRAIAIAIGRIKKWARGGGGVKADTVAKAAAAVAEWEALKAKAHMKYDSDLLEHIEHKALVRLDLVEQLEEDGLYSVELKALVDDNATLADELAELGDFLEAKALPEWEPAVGVDAEFVDLLARGAEVKGISLDAPAEDDFAALLARRAELG